MPILASNFSRGGRDEWAELSGTMKTLLMIHHHLSKPKRLALATQRQQASWTPGCVYKDEPGFWHLSFPVKNTWPGSWIPGEDEYEQQEKSYPRFIHTTELGHLPPICRCTFVQHQQSYPCKASLGHPALLAHRLGDSLRSYSLPL